MHTCDWCNSNENIRYYDTVPCRWGCYYFCENKKCSTYYHNYIYSNDISNGTPHYLNVPETIEPLQCVFCGICNMNVIHLPFNDDDDHKTFCKNAKCFSSYLDFRRCNLDVYLDKIPFVFLASSIDKLNKRLVKDINKGAESFFPSLLV
jgi:hypothetical protein